MVEQKLSNEKSSGYNKSVARQVSIRWIPAQSDSVDSMKKNMAMTTDEVLLFFFPDGISEFPARQNQSRLSARCGACNTDFSSVT